MRKDGNHENYRKSIEDKLNSLIKIFDKVNYSKTDEHISIYRIYGEIFHIFSYVEEYVNRLEPLEDFKVKNKTNEKNALKMIYNYVVLNYANQISLKEISSLVGFSEPYFCKFIKRATNQTFLEFLNTYRCYVARLKLENTDIPITNIALESGFSSISYFSKVFKKIFGINPRAYRNNFYDKD